MQIYKKIFINRVFALISLTLQPVMENASIISRLMRRPSSWWHQFRTWQRTPISVAPLRDEQHVCLNCGDSFDGNFCPRCGQDAKTKRFTLRGAFLHMMGCAAYCG